jgi:hypothetical protein
LGSDLLEEEAIPPSPLSVGGGGGKKGASTGSKTDTPSEPTVSEHSETSGCSPSARSTRAGGGGVGPFGARVRPVLPIETGDRLNDHTVNNVRPLINGRRRDDLQCGRCTTAQQFSLLGGYGAQHGEGVIFHFGEPVNQCAVPRAASVRQLFAVMSRALASNSGRLRIRAAIV